MIKTYNDIEVTVLRSTPNPSGLVCEAASQTMFVDPRPSDDGLIKRLIDMNHHSVFEHASITFRITGCSRSLLAQITRHRTFKFTSSSQHYQDYSNYPFIIHQDQSPEVQVIYDDAFKHAQDSYIKLLEYSTPKEEARQVLPNASAVNLFVTCDARNLMYFFVQRRCARNVAEMTQVADAMWTLACTWFPELFLKVGPNCVMTGRCNQGRMQAIDCKVRTDN